MPKSALPFVSLNLEPLGLDQKWNRFRKLELASLDISGISWNLRKTTRCFTEPIWNLSKKEAAAKERDLTISNSDFLGKGWNMLKPSNSESCSLAAEGSSTEFRCGWSTLKHVETCWSDAAHACSSCFMHVPNCFIFAIEVQCRDLLLSFHQTVLGSQTLHRGNHIKHLDLQHLLPRVLQLLALNHHILLFLHQLSWTLARCVWKTIHWSNFTSLLQNPPDICELHRHLLWQSGWGRKTKMTKNVARRLQIKILNSTSSTTCWHYLAKTWRHIWSYAYLHTYICIYIYKH